MAKTVFDPWQGDEATPDGATPDGATFLERALARALGALDGDASLSAVELQAAKSALSAALTHEIRDLLSAPRGRRVTAPPPSPFTARARQNRPGYFRDPSQAVGVSEGADAEVGPLEVRLTGGTATWLRLMPAHDTGHGWTCAALRAAMLEAGREVRPIFADARATGLIRAEDGFGIYATSPSATESSGVVFCFRSGEIWSVDTYVQDALGEQRPNRAIMTLQPELTAAFDSYVGLLDRLRAPRPYRWIIGMDGLLGRSIAFPEGDMAGLLRGDCLLNTVEVEGGYDGEPTEQAIQPFFDELYKACSTPVS